MPRAVHLGSQVSVAAASGICAAILAGLPTRLLLFLLSCELDSLEFLELSLLGLHSEFLEVVVKLQTMLSGERLKSEFCASAAVSPATCSLVFS